MAVTYSGFATLKEALEAHKAWLIDTNTGKRAYLGGANLGGADLRGADLRGADLGGAYLGGADLRGADLGGAYLGGAYLRGADLGDAYLGGAYLRGADLRDANLGGAYLRGADLRDANLRDAYLPAGYKWEIYISDVVPALCTAGGVALDVVAAAWNCHEWTNCPMAIAFGVTSLEDVPPLYRREAEFFVQLFDARLLPNPIVSVAA